MIKANELRIGNWVLFSPSGRKAVVKDRPVRVKELSEKTFLTDDGGLSLELFYESASAMPIPLTPEILIACGFEKDKLGWDKPDNNNIKLYQFKGNPIMMCWNENVIGIQIHSLHQLQNLYFALTGEELNYKPLKL